MNYSKEVIEEMLDDGLSFADIGKYYGITRERVRQIANRLGVVPACRVCGKKKENFRVKICHECRNTGVESVKLVNTLEENPVIAEAYQYFNFNGIPRGVKDKNAPDIVFGDVKMKCFKMSPMSSGFNSLVRKCDVDYYYFSDLKGNVFIIPSHAMKKFGRVHIGRQFDKWRSYYWMCRIVEVLTNDTIIGAEKGIF